jgi:hypothetical protein
MKFFLLASILLTQLTSNAQSSVYKPFCNNPSWTVVATNFGMSSYTTYQYQIDTIIGIHTYKKIKDVNSSAFALFREDAAQKKVYQYDITNSLEYLYIDFNLNYGDPFNLTLGGSVYSLTVCTKDSMLINGCYHNKIVLSNDGCFVRYNFVEGILSDVNPINPFTWPGDPQVWTTCECHNGQFYYTYLGSPFAPFNCNLTCSPEVACSVVNEIMEFSANLLSVYPNPTSGKLKLISQNLKEKESCMIKITDMLGREVKQLKFEDEIDVTELEKGIYFVAIVQNGKTFGVKKIVKQ